MILELLRTSYQITQLVRRLRNRKHSEKKHVNQNKISLPILLIVGGAASLLGVTILVLLAQASWKLSRIKARFLLLSYLEELIFSLQRRLLYGKKSLSRES